MSHHPETSAPTSRSATAALLGVSPWTLRHWDRAGKLKSLRHPVNGYRLYRREELEALLVRAAGGDPRQETMK
ncbi:MAG: MerR family DNA-binding transcriptional regulator [Isosphaeraceae bacterium]